MTHKLLERIETARAVCDETVEAAIEAEVGARVELARKAWIAAAVRAVRGLGLRDQSQRVVEELEALK